MKTKVKRKNRGTLARVSLLTLSLLSVGVAYTAFSATMANAQNGSTTANVQKTLEEGNKLFQANCASCHGINAEGSKVAPSLIGVGAASVDFQVGTGRMPAQINGPQAEKKPVQFTQEQISSLADYVASLSPGPGLPDPKIIDGQGNAAKGAELFRINCAMCHNVAGAGGALTEGKYAPSLSDVKASHIYEAMVTGPQNMPVFNNSNLSPEEKRDIITYIKFTQDTRSPGGFELASIGPVAEGLFLWIIGLGAIVALTVWVTAKSN